MADLIGEAFVRVSADTEPAENSMRRLAADFDRRMADMDRQKAEATISGNMRELDKVILRAKDEIAGLEKEKAEVEITGDGSDLANAIKIAKAQLKDLERHKTHLNIEYKDLQAANKELARSNKLQQENARMTSAANRERVKATQAARRESEAVLRSARDVDKLRIAYAKVYGERKRLEKSARGRIGFPSQTDIRALKAASSEMDYLGHKIKQLGGNIADIDPDMEHHEGLLRSWASSLSSVRLQLGFFSATMRQLGIGLVALGPLITGLLGAATSLIGVLGTGLAGGLSVASAGLAGFLLTAGGIGLVMKPAIDEFKEAHKATEAYAKAVLKYGKNSDQAKTAQEQMNHVLAGISPTARQAAKGWEKMKASWSSLTGGTKGDILGMLNSSIKTANSLLPTFARETVKSTKVASEAWDGWMKGLRSSEAKKLLSDTMAGFRGAIPGIASGLGSIAAAFGRISASASGFLPELSRGFDDWANKIEAAVGGGDKLDSGMERLITHFRDLGHLTQSTGSFLTHMLSTSADSGDDLVKTLTRVMDRWDDWVQSTGGQESLKRFFSEAADESKSLFSVLGHFTQIMFQIGRATAPITEGFMEVAKVIGDLLTSIPQLGSALKIAGVAGATLWAVGRVRAFASAVRGAAAAMGIFTAAEAAAGVAGTGPEGVFGSKGGTKGAGRMAALSRLGSLGMMVAAGVGVATIGMIKLEGAIDNSNDSLSETAPLMEQAGKAWEVAFGRAPRQADMLNAVLDKQVSLSHQLQVARKRAADAQPGSAKELTAQRQVAALERQQIQNQVQLGQRRTQVVAAARGELQSARARIQAARDLIKASSEERKGLEMAGVGPGTDKYDERLRAEARAHREIAAARRDAAEAGAALAASTVNVRRQSEGLVPVTQKTVEQLRELQEFAGRRATGRVSRFVDPEDVARAAKLANNLRDVGRGSQAKNILINSKGAEQTIGKLRQLQQASAKVDRRTISINARTKGSDQAKQQLTGLARQSQRISGTRATLRILANTTNAEQAANRIEAHLKAVALRRYQAKIEAADLTKGPLSNAERNMLAVAQRQYRAELKGIDNASNPAKTAKRAIDQVKSKSVNVGVTGATQAQGEVAALQSAIDSLHGKSVYVGLTGPGANKYEGGPSMYMKAFALGGDVRQRMLDRAAEQAVVRPGNRSQKISRPTMLTGEEAPRHNEYVIATNPAYRSSNERYLGAAANEMGYEVVPAYAKGKAGLAKAKKASAPGGGEASGWNQDDIRRVLSKRPKNADTSEKHFDPVRRLYSPKELNRAASLIERFGREYNAERGREEGEIAAGRMQEWDWTKLRGYLTKQQGARSQMSGILTKTAKKEITDHSRPAIKFLNNTGSATNVARLRKEANASAAEASAAKKQPGESDASYNKRKAGLKKDATAKMARYKQVKREADEAKALLKEAKKQRSELDNAKVERETDITETGTELQYLSDVEQGLVDKPYENSAEKAKRKEEEIQDSVGSAPSLAEQTSTYNTAREDLYRQFASNITGTPSSGGIVGAGYGSAAASGASPASIGYGPGGSSGGLQVVAGSGAGGKVVSVTNNFAAPPPDPHTWTAQQSFELGNL